MPLQPTVSSSQWVVFTFGVKTVRLQKIIDNQLEKLEAAKAAGLVCLSLLSLTGFFLVLLGPSGSIFTDLTGAYLALLGLTEP